MAGGTEYAECARMLLGDEGVDALIVTIVPPPTQNVVAIAESLVPVLSGASKPAAVSVTGGALAAEAREKLRAAGIMECGYPCEAVLVIAAAWRRQRANSADGLRLAKLRPNMRAAASTLVRNSPRRLPASVLAGKLAKSAGLHLPKSEIATGVERAAQAAVRVGFPVVLKAVGARLVHKTEAGGVATGLASANEVRRAYREMRRNVAARAGEGALEGVMVQAMVPSGQEVIVGAVRDPQFGPLLMFGSGGKEVEGLGDIAFALAPLTLEAAEGMLASTWAGRRLAGVRGGPPGNRKAVLAALAGIERLMLENPEVLEFEVNPLIVTARAAWAVDVRAGLAPSSAPGA